MAGGGFRTARTRLHAAAEQFQAVGQPLDAEWCRRALSSTPHDGARRQATARRPATIAS